MPIPKVLPYSLLLLSILFWSFRAEAVNTPAPAAGRQLTDQLQKYIDFSNGYTQEKVYLHFDNHYYYLGENIWFKAYVLLAGNHHFSPMSKTLYVELLDAGGQLIETQKLRIEDGQTHGGIYLKNTFKPGFYEVRAYTRCMLNFGQEVVFSRVFPVMDQRKFSNGKEEAPGMTLQKEVLVNKRIDHSKWEDDLRIEFYPEGGQLIADIPQNLAFKAFAKDGQEVILSGNLLDKDKNPITVFSSMHQSMGCFEFTPQAGQVYTAQLLYKNKRYSFPLPEILSGGYALKVNNLDARFISAGIYTHRLPKSDSVALVLTGRGSVYAYQAFSVETEGLITLNIPKKTLPSGVYQLTLFDTRGNTLAERMLFVRNPLLENEIVLNYTQLQGENRPFEPISIQFHAKRRSGADSGTLTPEVCRFSLAIRDGSSYTTEEPSCNLYAELLLASDLKGYIENPNFYFRGDSQRQRMALDLLMMVQGWRRYDFQTMVGRQHFESKHPIEEDILLQGKVLSIMRRKPQKGVKVTMWMTSDSTAFYGNCLTDSTGSFNFLFHFENTWKLSMQVQENDKRKNYFITIDRQFSPPAKPYHYVEKQIPPFRLLLFDDKTLKPKQAETTRDRSDILIMPGDVLLPQAEVKEKAKPREEHAVIVSYQVKQEMDVLEDQAEYTQSDIIYFLEQIDPHFWVNVVDTEEILYYKGSPVKFIDMFSKRIISMSTNDPEYIIDQIEKIEVCEPGAQMLHLLDELPEIHEINKRVTYVLLYRYKDGHREISPVGIRYTSLQGYTPPKAFYHPHYDRILPSDPDDHRRTLYWNPDVQTDAEGNASIRFYNNASCRHLIFDAEVITADGAIGSLKPEQ